MLHHIDSLSISKRVFRYCCSCLSIRLKPSGIFNHCSGIMSRSPGIWIFAIDINLCDSTAISTPCNNKIRVVIIPGSGDHILFSLNFSVALSSDYDSHLASNKKKTVMRHRLSCCKFQHGCQYSTPPNSCHIGWGCVHRTQTDGMCPHGDSTALIDHEAMGTFCLHSSAFVIMWTIPESFAMVRPPGSPTEWEAYWGAWLNEWQVAVGKHKRGIVWVHGLRHCHIFLW
jgi:hypothetical protein